MTNYTASSLVGYGYMGAEYSFELSYLVSPYYALGLSQIGYNLSSSYEKGDNITVSTDLRYVTAVGSGPITLFLLGVISIILFFIYILLRQCSCRVCKWISCLPTGKKRDMKKVMEMPKYKAVEMEKLRLGGGGTTGNDDSMKIDEDLIEEANYERMIVEHASVQKQRKKMKYYLFPFLLILLVVIQLSLVGNTYFDGVYEDMTVTLDTLSATVTAISSKQAILINRGVLITETLINVINSTDCNSTRLDGLLPVMDSFNSNVNDLGVYVAALSDHLVLLQDNMEFYFGEYRQLVVYAIWCFCMLNLLCITFSTYSKYPYFDSCTSHSLKMSIILFIVTVVTVLPFLLLNFVMADICSYRDPLTAVQGLIPPQGGLANMSAYYSHCNGMSPVGSALDSTKNSTAYMNTVLLEVLRHNNTYATDPQCVDDSCVTCPANDDLIGMINTTSVLYTPAYTTTINGTSNTYDEDGVIIDAYSTIPCSTLQGLYQNTIYDTFCLDLYNGVFYISMSHMITNIALFVLIILLFILVPHTRYIADVRDYEQTYDHLKHPEKYRSKEDDVHDDDSDSDDDLEKAAFMAGGDRGEAGDPEDDYEFDEDGNAKRQTEFNWDTLDDLPALQEEKEDPYANPNGKPRTPLISANRRSAVQIVAAYGQTVLDLDEESLSIVKPKTIEEIVHFEAINAAGYEDED